MAWEGRARGGRYYTRSRREGGRVVREYVGTGDVAELLSAIDAADRAERQAAAEAWRSEQAAMVERRERSRALCRLIDDAVAAELVRRGYHEHKGEWRRWRH